MLEAYT